MKELGMGRDRFLPRRDETRNSDGLKWKFRDSREKNSPIRMRFETRRDRKDALRDRIETSCFLDSRDETGRDSRLAEKSVETELFFASIKCPNDINWPKIDQFGSYNAALITLGH